MKKILILLHTFIIISVNAQNEKIEMISKYDNAEFGSKQFVIENFQGIEKLTISFTNSEKLIGKDFKIVVRKYVKGKLDNEKIIIDTKKGEYSLLVRQLGKVYSKKNISVMQDIMTLSE